MIIPFNRRQFIGSLAALPFALEAAVKAQRVAPEEAARLRAEVMSPFPVIDTHIHIFDKSRAKLSEVVRAVNPCRPT